MVRGSLADLYLGETAVGVGQECDCLQPERPGGC